MAENAAVLLYNLNQSEKGRKIKFILIRMGIKIKNIAKEDYLQPVGALAGIPGIERNELLYTENGFEEEMLVMKGFSEHQLNDFLNFFRREKIEKVNLKAVLTPSNQTWTSLRLYEELKKEHDFYQNK